MKHLRLVFASLAIAGAGVWAVAAVACDQKSTTAANGACTPMTSAECKARMTAGQPCPMKGASAVTASTASMGGGSANGQCSARAMKSAAAGKCPYSGATATTAEANAECCAHASGASATTASYKSAKDAGQCPTHTINAMTVSNGNRGINAMAVSNSGNCAAHGAAGATAAHEGCSMKSAGATAAGHGACSAHNVSAMAAGLGSNCGAHERGAGVTAHADCDACDDLASCDAELQAAGATMQTVPIKNGVMFVYTASSPGRVNAIQSVMTRRTEHLSRIIASGTRARLCDDCKSMRGAMASGRMVREVVNIEGGTLVLVTSDDPALVKRIRDLADAGKTAVKS